MADLVRKMRPSAGLVFFICLAVYVAIIPCVARHAWPTGDEPAYLLLAHRLIHDHDFDLANNYQAKDYLRFYPVDLNEHTITNSRGEHLLIHDIGIPVLLVPGYWADGRLGAMLETDIAAALLAVAIFLLACQLGASEMAALITALLFAFSSPLVYFSSQIYPEMLGAACCAWAAAFFMQYVMPGDWRG